VSATFPRVLAPLALMALIFYLSAQPAVAPELPGWTRVAAHFTQFALLAAAWAWTLAPLPGRAALAVAAATSLAYAISDEYHQSFVDGRDADPLDVLVDAAGIAFALSLIAARGRRTARRALGPPA
jgi:VanZ family protein